MVFLTNTKKAWVSASAALALSCAAGCGAQSEAAGLPTPPPLPAGWTVTETDTGDLRLALPPEVQPSSVNVAILANEPPIEPGAASWFEVLAIPPLSLSAQPDPGRSVEDWLQEQASQGTPGAALESRSVALPAGDAIELRMSFFLGSLGRRLSWRTPSALQQATGICAWPDLQPSSPRTRMTSG